MDNKKVKILFVCGYGVGSSLMAETMVSKKLKEMKVNAELDHAALGELDSMMSSFDIICISKKLAEGVNFKDKPYIEMVNVMDSKGISEQILKIVEEKFPEALEKKE